jgi:hypothetical protein
MNAPLAGHSTLERMLEQIKNTLWIMATVMQFYGFVTKNGDRFRGCAGRDEMSGLALACLGGTAF